jgi:hypothetical protein
VFSPPFAAHGKFQLPEMRTPILAASYYRCGTMSAWRKARPERACRACLNFIKFDCVEFDEAVDFVKTSAHCK